MTRQRWLRIIPVALIMYTISYVDRTNVSLALDGKISSMLRDLAMDDRMKGLAAGVFFIGYCFLQVPGGYIAQRWSPKKLVSIALVVWGVCAMSCGLVHSYRAFTVARFFLGMAESGVFPATMILLARWFPRSERVRACALWCVCQPMAVVISAPATGWVLQHYGWRVMLVLEGALPILWLPVWWLCISDRPADAKTLPAAEREFLEESVRAEVLTLEPPRPVSLRRGICRPEVLVMMVIGMLYTGAAYGCMTFFTTVLKDRSFTGTQYGILFALPYLITIGAMMLNSWHSDKTQERRGHVAIALALSGASLILSVTLRGHFWASYAFMCLAIPGPFAVLGPFFAIPTETFPRSFLGLLLGAINAVANLGGFIGPYFVGGLTNLYHSTAVPFFFLGAGLLAAALLSSWLPKTIRTWD